MGAPALVEDAGERPRPAEVAAALAAIEAFRRDAATGGDPPPDAPSGGTGDAGSR